MPNLTTNLHLNTWLENEDVDFEEVNSNFNIIDGLTNCFQSGTITSSYTGGSDANATWRYKKYTDGTVYMTAKLYFTNLKCNGGASSPYYSGDVQLNFPFTFSEITNVQIMLASNTIGWASNITGQTVIDNVRFRVMGTAYEDDYIYKQVFVTVEGVLA